MTKSNSDQDRRVRVLYFDHTAAWSGGEIALFNLIRALDKSRFEPIVVLCAEGPLEVKLRAIGVECTVVPLDHQVLKFRKDRISAHSLTELRTIWKVGAYILKLRSWIVENRIDIVHTNSLKSDIIGGIAARLADVPVVWHVRDRIAEDYLRPAAVKAFRTAAKIIPSFVIANSRATLETIKLGDNAKTAPIYSGTTFTGNEATAPSVEGRLSPHQDNDSDRAFRVGLVGRLSPWKGQHVFIDAAKLVLEKASKVEFFIIGAALFDEKNYELQLKQQVNTLNLQDSVHFLGFCTDVPKIMGTLDLVVHASTTGEPFGQVIVEAMASSKPIVATNGGGVPEIVVDGVTGTLIPMNDHVSMAHAILRMQQDPLASAEMGRAGAVRSRQHFSIERTARSVENVYSSLLSGDDQESSCSVDSGFVQSTPVTVVS